MRRSITLASLLIATAVPLRAQEFGLYEIESLARQNAEAYIRPVTEGLGHALTAGFAETARTHRLLGFDLGIRVMAALPSPDFKTFTAILPTSIEYRGFTFHNPYAAEDGRLETPTAIGDEPGIVLTPQGSYRSFLVANGEDPEYHNVYFPHGLELPITAVPFATLQASIGLPYDTEFMFRLIPTVTPDEDVGGIRASGFGLKHTVTRWLPGAPVDAAVFVGTQRFQVGDYLDARARTYGVILSRALGPLTAFVQARGANAHVSIGYTVENYDDDLALPEEGSRIEFDAEVPNGIRAGGGLTLRVIGIGLTGEYTAGPQDVFSFKLGMSIR